MLVKDLIEDMSCSQICSIRIYEFNEKGDINNLFRYETKGDIKVSRIPDSLKNRKVKYYHIEHTIHTTKEVTNNYENYEYKDLPYIELELQFNICVRGVSSND